MVEFKYRIRTQIISIVEFGWSVFVLIYILHHIPDYVEAAEDPEINGIFVTTLVTAIATSILQLVSSVLLSFGSVGIEITRDDVAARLKFIERWDTITGWRICLLLPSAFFAALTIIKVLELFVAIVTVFLVHDYLLELENNLGDPRNDLPPAYFPSTHTTTRIGRRSFPSYFINSPQRGDVLRTQRVCDGASSHNQGPQSTHNIIRGSIGSNNGIVPPPPPPYEPPPRYADIIIIPSSEKTDGGNEIV